jgi:FMN phosphatase YigB (HAD superfamily)
VAKPDPATFTLACRRLGVEPGDALSVGDWRDGDAVAAARAGLTGIWLDRGVDPLTGGPTEEPATPDPALVRIERLTNLGAYL